MAYTHPRFIIVLEPRLAAKEVGALLLYFPEGQVLV